jgi:hypothetical protein
MHLIFLFFYQAKHMHQLISLIGGLLAAAGSIDRVHSPCSTLVRGRISAAPPRCSPDTCLGKKLRGCASGEQRRGAAEILTQTGVEYVKCTQLRIRQLSHKCRKRYVCKYVDH